MLDQTSLHEEQAKRFTSLIARRIGLANQSQGDVLPTPEDYGISNIERISADIAVIKLYCAILICDNENDHRHMIAGIVWLASKSSDWMKIYLTTVELDIKDSLSVTQSKLIHKDNCSFFYNRFLHYEFIIPMAKLIGEYNARHKDIPANKPLVLEAYRLIEIYDNLSLLSPLEDKDILIKKVKTMVMIKNSFSNLVANCGVAMAPYSYKKSDNNVVNNSYIMDMYNGNKTSAEPVDLLSIYEKAFDNNDNFLINTSDITFSPKAKSKSPRNVGDIKRDMLRVLKKSKSLTAY